MGDIKGEMNMYADDISVSETEVKGKLKKIKNSEEFENEIKSNAIVFADFYATWCMPCKMMSGIIDELAKEHQEVKFIKIDVDQNTELAIKYNVMSIPTMIIFKNGNTSKTFIGVTDKSEIIAEF